MPLPDTTVDAIAARLDSWVRFGEPAPAEGDVTALVTEVRLMRRVHANDLALINQCRADVAQAWDEYRALAVAVGLLAAEEAS